ncbi:nucleotidyltransferase domain-containing protein [Sorangium sp. So ce131]|uniref:nucleotidyltransferase domain-containing protein n=1 Tax=Sorangium sp. So ce131 TaxID=3133282 RepID=UPI003F5F1508
MGTRTSQAGGRAPSGRSGTVAVREAAEDARGRPIDLSPVETLLARIKDRCHPEQIWLFGSRARGDARPWSDWDLLVVVPDDIDESELSPLLSWRLQKGSGVPADVLLCRRSDFVADRETVNTIAYDVASEGVLIYER